MGSFGNTDAPEAKSAPRTKKPWTREKAQGRKIDAAGKLAVQSARPELKETDGIDPKRKPQFKNI
jgi:hypothetical protein